MSTLGLDHKQDPRIKTVMVRVNRNLSFQQVLDGTPFSQHISQVIEVENIPLVPGTGEEDVEFVFFNLGSMATPAMVTAKLVLLGLKLDIAAQAKYNADNPDFMDKQPNAAYWDRQGNINMGCLMFANFSERKVSVEPSSGEAGSIVWYGGTKI